MNLDAPVSAADGAVPAPGTWVLIRGLARERAHWGTFPALLLRALRSGRVLMVDLPGTGLLHEQPCPLRVEAMVQACREQLVRAGATGPYRLVGLSLGGMVAAAWLVQHPQEVAACALVNSSLRPLSPLHHRLLPRQWPGLLRVLLHWGSRTMEHQVLLATSSRPDRHAAVAAHWVSIARQRPVSRLNALRQLLAAARFRLRAPLPDRPLLVVSSAADALVDPRCSEALARHFGAPLVRHERAGHDLALDDGAWLAARLAEWARHRPAADPPAS